MKSIITILIFFLLTFSVTENILAQWQVETKADPMSGEEYWVTKSSAVEPSQQMEIPYEDINARLVALCGSGRGYFGFEFSDSPNLTNMTYRQDGVFITSRIKGDEQIHEVTFMTEVGNNTIKIVPDDLGLFVETITVSSELMVELEWFREGEVYFLFNLAGSKDAITEVLMNCKEQLNQ